MYYLDKLIYISGFKKAIFVALLYSFAITFVEILIRNLQHIVSFSIVGSFFITFTFVFCILTTRWKILSWFLTLYVGLGIISEFSNLIYFGYWLQPMDIWLTFSKISEVIIASKDVIFYNLFSFILVSMAFLSTISLPFLRKNIKKSKVVGFLIIILLSLYPARVYFKNSDIGRKSDLNFGVTKTTLYTFSNFIGRILPNEVFDLSNVPSYHRKSPHIEQKPIAKNIILIVGESLSASYSSVFGYKKITTPFLSSELKNPNSIVKETFSSGLFTDVSVPFILNMIQKPNANKQIASNDTSLFKLAKQQGYQTYFFSAQPSTGLGFLPYLGQKYIDYIQTSYDITHDIYKKVDDNSLVYFLNHQHFGEKTSLCFNKMVHMSHIQRSRQKNFINSEPVI